MGVQFTQGAQSSSCPSPFSQTKGILCFLIGGGMYLKKSELICERFARRGELSPYPPSRPEAEAKRIISSFAFANWRKGWDLNPR